MQDEPSPLRSLAPGRLDQISDGVQGLGDTLAGDRGDLHRADGRRDWTQVTQVGLAQDDQSGPGGEIGRVVGDLPAQYRQLLLRSVELRLSRIEQDDQDTRALDVTKEFVSEAFALTSEEELNMAVANENFTRCQ